MLNTNDVEDDDTWLERILNAVVKNQSNPSIDDYMNILEPSTSFSSCDHTAAYSSGFSITNPTMNTTFTSFPAEPSFPQCASIKNRNPTMDSTTDTACISDPSASSSSSSCALVGNPIMDTAHTSLPADHISEPYAVPHATEMYPMLVGSNPRLLAPKPGPNQGSNHQFPRPPTPSVVQSPNRVHNSSTRKRRRPSKDELGSKKYMASSSLVTTFSVGSWQRVSRQEGELMAKFYFRQGKLIWEFLDGSLKKKMEISLHEITALNAVMLPDQPGILQIELGRPPLFSGETDLIPLKHSKWETVPDFTQGQALLHRIHRASFPPGELDKHLQKLLDSDEDLMKLSRLPFPTPDSSPYFNQQYACPNLAYSPPPPPPTFPLPAPPSITAGLNQHNQCFQAGELIPAQFNDQMIQKNDNVNQPTIPNGYINLQRVDMRNASVDRSHWCSLVRV